jgi:hypothetical protein
VRSQIPLPAGSWGLSAKTVGGRDASLAAMIHREPATTDETRAGALGAALLGGGGQVTEVAIGGKGTGQDGRQRPVWREVP